MLVRRLGGIAIVVAAAAICVPASASALTRTQGSPMDMTPATGAEAFGCESYWLSGNSQRFLWTVELGIPMNSCSAFSVGTNSDNTHFVPGPGTVTTVRVKSGPNPAPLKVTVVKQLFQKNPNPPHQITDTICCTGTGRESATFQPQPNAVTEYAANLQVTTTPSVNGASGHQDIVAVSAVGPGDLPLASTGPHTGFPTAGEASIQAFYPKVETGLQGSPWHYANWVVLMNYDWTDGCPAGASSAKRKANAACTVGGGGGGGGAAVAPASVTSKSLRLKKRVVAVKVKCTAAVGQRCKGNVKLSTATKKPRQLARKSLNVAGGKSKTVKLKLSNKARKRLKKKTNKVQVEIDLGAAGKATKALSLKR